MANKRLIKKKNVKPKKQRIENKLWSPNKLHN